MRLKTIRVKNFRCIEDSSEFTVQSGTCLVGKNGAGKTSLLEALYKLNPDVEKLANFDVLTEYPRARRRHYEQRAERQPDDALETEWQLDPEEVQQLEDALGCSLAGANVVSVRKGYYAGRIWAIESPVTEQLAEEGQPGESVESSEEEVLSKSLPGESEDKEPQTNGDVVAHIDNRAFVKSYSRSIEDIDAETLSRMLEKHLADRLPKFLYFSEWNLIKGRVSLDALLARQEKNELTGPDRVFMALLELGGTDAEALFSMDRSEELIADLEETARPITDEISRYWSQEKGLRVTFHLHPGRPKDPAPFDQGLVFETRIVNPRSGLSLNFEERSTGFAWFFSFLIWYSQVQKRYGDNIAILLDDPGVGLHAKAQWDLVRYISDRLEPVYQVIYATHSPFMIDPHRLASVRTVADTVEKAPDGQDMYKGTKVGDTVLSTDHDTLLPLKASLGYRLLRSISRERRVLLVERPAEVLYLQWFSSRLREKGRLSLGPQWSIVPCGNLTGLASLVGLMSESRAESAVLLSLPADCDDLASSGEVGSLLRSSRVFLLSSYAKPASCTLEDLIGDAYLTLVDLSYGLPKRQRLSRTLQRTEDVPILKLVQEHFSANVGAVSDFDSTIPAQYMMENRQKCLRRLPGIADAIERFEGLFKSIV